jgi:hypothetical protein
VLTPLWSRALGPIGHGRSTLPTVGPKAKEGGRCQFRTRDARATPFYPGQSDVSSL